MTTADIPGTADMPGTDEIPGTHENSGADAIPGTHEIAGTDAIPGTDRIAGAADIPGADGQERPVDPRSVYVWRWTTVLASVPLVAGALTAAAGLAAAGLPLAVVLFTASPLAIFVPALLAWWYPGARYRHLRYRLDDTGIVIRDGIFWRSESALPHVRIQHTDVAQGPLQRRYGVATLKLYTAGSRFTRIELPGLEYAVAVALRDVLQRRGRGDAV